MKYLNYTSLCEVSQNGTEDEKNELIGKYTELLNDEIDTKNIVLMVCDETEVLKVRKDVEKIIKVNNRKKRAIIKPTVLKRYLEKIKVDNEDYEQIKELIAIENTIAWYEFVIEALKGNEELLNSEE